MTSLIELAERVQGFPPGWTSVEPEEFKENARWLYVGNAVAVAVASNRVNLPLDAWAGEALTHQKSCSGADQGFQARDRILSISSWGAMWSSWRLVVERFSCPGCARIRFIGIPSRASSAACIRVAGLEPMKQFQLIKNIRGGVSGALQESEKDFVSTATSAKVVLIDPEQSWCWCNDRGLWADTWS